MKKIAFVCMLGSALIISACSFQAAAADDNSPAADVKIINTKGEQIGMAKLMQIGDKVQVTIKAHKLPPGLHGFHFHSAGRCDPPDFKTAEAHFNPHDKQHGFDNPKGFHAGDLPNLDVDADGKVEVTMSTTAVTLEKGKPNSLIRPGGTALIIHTQPDDYVTDPTGNSGDRIACGAIN
ncbi:superoxide dismutase family protein [Paenibacillus thiaminolyticus]|uniref:Superoxide dismutase [Cu-Zn] n=1 Tax=Paenibacillus thiaminolyticus TaxID=49283 RepID=A0AAP9IZZ2_PANTH|nr:superoxide dismutase family protein [Paenibacillus thiaminolyticus]MCY9537812.1 superoxide dismutase family protein [Paenibacillus thiaminolyticus]MCY9605104.1 superoxide dismutase family protein [Paenibacillus thiaminolyticus]MCY9607209.1 superoxide dismutase family protein [Paenibacillus thiaminolyticus]MCY9616334.1 superoxide dismutase family protein [Paenibacillus thiaminolyticus]MCY9620013.1 superoxide dismutase family protein [Paenibacillus thiaminolyticus]